MDWVRIVYSIILLVCIISVILAPSSRKGDERRKFITAKAQSYSFMVIIVVLMLDVVKSIYLTIQGKATYEFLNPPVMILTLISIVYVITFLVYRKKYGD